MSDLDDDCWVCEVDFDTIEELAENFEKGRKEYEESELLCKGCFTFLSTKFNQEDILKLLAWISFYVLQ